MKTKIEWTDYSWNPILALNKTTGKKGHHCEHVTTGCEFCYAESMNKRLGTGLPFKPGHRTDVEIFLDEKMLTQPLRWKQPRMIFTCSMTDLFADFVLDEWIDRVFAVMALAPQHTFQVLTKRPERMREYAKQYAGLSRNIGGSAVLIMEEFESIVSNSGVKTTYPIKASRVRDEVIDRSSGGLPNVWLGVSAEDQAAADERVPILLDTPAAIRFVSLEPMIGPIDLTNIDPTGMQRRIGAHGWSAIWKNNLLGRAWLDWVIVGGESGSSARPFIIGHAREIVRQCAAAGVPVFVKQLGARPVNREGQPHKLVDRKGGDITEFPPDLQVREMPRAA